MRLCSRNVKIPLNTMTDTCEQKISRFSGSVYNSFPLSVNFPFLSFLKFSPSESCKISKWPSGSKFWKTIFVYVHSFKTHPKFRHQRKCYYMQYFTTFVSVLQHQINFTFQANLKIHFALRVIYTLENCTVKAWAIPKLYGSAILFKLWS